jgi:hypothetical protein
MGKMRNTHDILIGKPGCRMSHARMKLRWEDNIRIDLREIHVGWEFVDWIHLAHNRDQFWALVNAQRIFGFPERQRIS